MFTETNKYKKSGHFFFNKGVQLSDVSKDVPDLPGYVEGLIMQRFYEVYGRLPEWNKDF